MLIVFSEKISYNGCNVDFLEEPKMNSKMNSKIKYIFLSLFITIALTGCHLASRPKEAAVASGLTSGDFEQLLKDYEAERSEPHLPVLSFGDTSHTAWEDELSHLKSLKFNLDSIDSSTLDSRQRLLFHILNDYCSTELSKEGLESFHLLTCLSTDENTVMTALKKLNRYPLQNRQDIEDYLTLMADFPRYMDDFFALVSYSVNEEDLSFSQTRLTAMMNTVAPYLLAADYNLLVTSFEQRISCLPDLSPEEAQAYQNQNKEAVAQYVIPALTQLQEDLFSLPLPSYEEKGLCHRPEGDRYYRYLVKHTTNTSYQHLDDILFALEQQLMQNTQSINGLLAEYPALESGSLDFASITDSPNHCLDFLQQQVNIYFPPLPAATVTVVTASGQNQDALSLPYWLVDANGGSAGTHTDIYLSPETISQPVMLYFTLAQTAFPGSLYRSSYLANQPQISPLQKQLPFSGWEKGWDNYAKSYALSFDNGLSSQEKSLLRLSTTSALALGAMIDLQVNYKGWDKDQVSAYLSEQYHLDDEQIARNLYERAVYSPSSALAEYLGCFEIRQMKTKAREAMGASFQDQDFHAFFLSIGPAPYGVIQQELDKWIMTNNSSFFNQQ